MYIPTARMATVVWHLALTAFAAPALVAAEPENDLVPLEVITDIVGGNISRSLPSDFPLPGKGLPDGMSLRLIASRNTNYLKEIYLRTSSEVMEFRQALAEAYVAAGWIDVSYSPIRRDPISIDALFFSLCHDELGSLSIDDNGREDGENKIVLRYRPTVAAPPIVNGSTCAEIKAYNDSGYPSGILSFFQAQIPALRGPEDAVEPSYGIGVSPFFSGSLTGGLTQRLRSSQQRTLVLTDYLLVRLYVHMVEQLEEQGWLLDNHVSSRSVSSSVWSKTVSGPEVPAAGESWDMDLTGILTLIDQGEDTWLVQFELWSE